jgi:hypothetical protein
VSLTKEGYEKALASGLVQQLQLPLKRAGAYQLRSAIRDRQSDRIGSASEFIEVPELKRDALALSGIVLQRADARGLPTQAASVSTFHRGETIAYAYQILNAHPEASNLVGVQVRAALRHEEAELGTSESVTVDAKGQTDPKRIVVSNSFRLGKQLAPGAYTFRVTAVENRGSAKWSTATQSVDFEVIE